MADAAGLAHPAQIQRLLMPGGLGGCRPIEGIDKLRAPARQALCRRLPVVPPNARPEPLPVLWSRDLASRPNATFSNERPFPVSAFRRYMSMLPEHSAVSGNWRGACDDCASCAVVGASGSLLSHEHGALIDAHTVVLRPNWLKIKGYEVHVGRRTTLNVIFALENMLDQFIKAQRRQPPEARAIGLATPSSPRGINSFFRYIGRRQLNASHPISGRARHTDQPLFLLSDRLWERAVAHLCVATDEGCQWPTRTSIMRPSSGFFAVLVALQTCRNVSLFGFTSDPCLPFHYYGPRPKVCLRSRKNPHKTAVPKANDEIVHWFDKEHEIYFQWQERGWLRIHS